MCYYSEQITAHADHILVFIVGGTISTVARQEQNKILKQQLFCRGQQSLPEATNIKHGP